MKNFILNSDINSKKRLKIFDWELLVNGFKGMPYDMNSVGPIRFDHDSYLWVVNNEENRRFIDYLYLNPYRNRYTQF